MTTATKQSDIKRAWHHVDVQGKVLGRISVEIAHTLMGKGKAHFVRNLDCGDYVVVTNAKGIVVTGKKAQQKTYYRHSMYPGGLKGETFEELLRRRPTEIIRNGVKGMVPQNKLRASMLKRLIVFSGDMEKYQDKFGPKVHQPLADK